MKSPVQSKTIWFNVVLGMIDIFALGAHENLSAFLSDDVIRLILFILGIVQAGGNIWLRFKTTQPIVQPKDV